MTQNIYDDPTFFQAYSQMGRSLGGLDAAPEWPALQALLPPMNGLRVLDLGCGYRPLGCSGKRCASLRARNFSWTMGRARK